MSQNDNYTIDLDGAPCVLRVWNLATRRQQQAEVTLLEYLASSGLPVPRLLAPTNGESMTIGGKPAAVFARIHGTPPSMESADYSSLVEEVTKVIARLHVCADGLEDQGYRQMPILSLYESQIAGIDLTNDDQHARRAVEDLERAVALYRTVCDEARPAVGVIHGDAADWNVLVDEEGKLAGLLDFDMAHRDYLVFDIANIVTQWAFSRDDSATELFDTALVGRVIRAYESVRPMSIEERKVLAIAVPLRHCILLLGMWHNDWSIGPVSRAEYLDRFSMLELTSDQKWLDLVVGR